MTSFTWMSITSHANMAAVLGWYRLWFQESWCQYLCATVTTQIPSLGLKRPLVWRQNALYYTMPGTLKQRVPDRDNIACIVRLATPVRWLGTDDYNSPAHYWACAPRPWTCWAIRLASSRRRYALTPLFEYCTWNHSPHAISVCCFYIIDPSL
jgi:hypothetical protein